MNQTSLAQNIAKRRTFAIISHPDAGKTTLTEKLLLYGGAIHLAGSVKSRKASRHACRLEGYREAARHLGHQQRHSISYGGFDINILDSRPSGFL